MFWDLWEVRELGTRKEGRGGSVEDNVAGDLGGKYPAGSDNGAGTETVHKQDPSP